MRFGNSTLGATLIAVACLTWACAATVALPAGPVPADAPEFIDDPASDQAQAPASASASGGKDLFEKLCSECHEYQYATQLRHTREGWTQVMGLMASNGFEATDAQKKLILDYLTETFAPGR